MAVFQESQGYCERCDRTTLIRGRSVNHTFHLVMTLLCCGWWLWIWAIQCLIPIQWRCSRCGEDVSAKSAGLPTSAFKVLGFVLLGLGAMFAVAFVSLAVLVAATPRPTTPAPPTTTDTTARPTEATSTERQRPDAAAKESTSSTSGPITAEVTSVEVRPVQVLAPFSVEKKNGPECLIVRVRFTNTDDTIDASKALFITTEATDEFGNVYKSPQLAAFDTIAEPGDYTDLTPGKPASRSFAFVKPIPKATVVSFTVTGRISETRREKLAFSLKVATPKPKLETPKTEPTKPTTPATEPRPTVKRPDVPLTTPTTQVKSTATLTPLKGETIYLGSAQYIVGTAVKEPEVRAKWLKDGQLKALTAPAEVEVVSRDKEYSKVKLDGKEWVVESKWLPAK